MGPGGFFGPPPGEASSKLKPQKPKNIKEVPEYLKKVIGGFFYRLFYIFKLVWETRPWILFVMLFMAIFNGVMPVIGAYISAELLNSLSEAFVAATQRGENLFPSVMFFLLLQLAHILLGSIVGSIDRIVSRIYGELVVNNIKLKIMNKAKEIDLAGFDRPEFYEKLENASNEAGHRPIHIMTATFSAISSVITLVSFITILWALSPYAPLIMILLSIPSAVLTFIYRRKNFMYIRHRSKDRRQLSYFSGLLTNKDMVKEIRIFGLANTFIKKYDETFKKYFKGLRKLFVLEGVWDICISTVTSIVRCGLFLFIAYGVSQGIMKIGDYSLYTGALNSVASCVGGLISVTATIYEGTLFIDNMIVFMNEKKTVIPNIAAPIKPERHKGHEIVFENVSFRYPGTERDVIKNLNVTINPGESVVLVGLNGAGKTTLIKLLTRLYDPTEGRILLDGKDIKNYDTNELYKIFGIIFQDFGKYAVSVTDNIAFGELEKEIVDSNIHMAATQADADDFIDKLPDKYNTPLMRIFEENGIELSIGQWQKLAVARAFYSDSDILILDEPTASLDAIAEQEIYSQFDLLRKDKTTIFVSHRLSSATVASKIIVLEYGEMIELGNHRELMAKKGRYYELFSTQAARYISDPDVAPDAPPPMPEGMPFPNGAEFPKGFPPRMPGGRPGFPPPFGGRAGGPPPFGEMPRKDIPSKPENEKK